MKSINEVVSDVGMWANSALGVDREPAGAITKLAMEEAPELWRALRDTGVIDKDEIADVLILALDICFMANIDAEEAIRSKLDQNKIREWTKTNGVMHHVPSKD